MSPNRLLIPRFLILLAMTLAAALSRLIPHPPNFAPMGALALFGGVRFRNRRPTFGVPLVVSLLSSATEIICTLGLGDHLVGVTHALPDGLPAAIRVDTARGPMGSENLFRIRWMSFRTGGK